MLLLVALSSGKFSHDKATIERNWMVEHVGSRGSGRQVGKANACI